MASNLERGPAAPAPPFAQTRPAADIFEQVFGRTPLAEPLGGAAPDDGDPLDALLGLGGGARAALAGVRHLLGRGERTEVFGAELPFVLRCAHGAYLRVGADDTVTADGADPADAACLFVVQKGGVALHMRCTFRAECSLRRLARLPGGEVRACGGTQPGPGAPDAERWLVEQAPASTNRALVWLRCRRPAGRGDWDHALTATPDGAVRVAPWSPSGTSQAQLFHLLDPEKEAARCAARRAAAEHAAAEAAARKRVADLAAALAAAQLEADSHARQREALLRAARTPPATHTDALRAAARHMREVLGYVDAAVKGELIVSTRAVAACADPADATAPTQRGPLLQLVGDAAPPSPYAGRELLFFSVTGYEEEARAVGRVRCIRLFVFDAQCSSWAAVDAA